MTVRKSHYKMRRCDCGATPRFEPNRCAEDGYEAFVFCPSCGAAGESVEDHYPAEADAVSLWNRKVLMPRGEL